MVNTDRGGNDMKFTYDIGKVKENNMKKRIFWNFILLFATILMISGCKAKKDNKVAVQIEQMEGYYHVSLNYDTGISHYDMGKEYAKAILNIMPDYAKNLDSYMSYLIDSKISYTKRIETVKEQLPEEYIDEIEGFASVIATQEVSILGDSRLSKEEIYLSNMIPDLCRPTACSGLSVFGDKSQTSKDITLRVLEWAFNKDHNEILKLQAVVDYNNGEHSFTSFGFLGIMDIISALNDDGIFAAILDNSERYYKESGTRSYTYDLRYALENYSTLDEVTDYMADNGRNYTFSHLILAADKEKSKVVENFVLDGGISAVRSVESMLSDNLLWDIPDSICVVNGNALKENVDTISTLPYNKNRFETYYERLKEYEKVSVSDIKDIIGKEMPKIDYGSIHTEYYLQIIIYDASTGSVEIAFMPENGMAPVKPRFVKVK